MNRGKPINKLQLYSFTIMVLLVCMFNYSTNSILKSITNLSVLIFIALVLIPMKTDLKVSTAFIAYCFFILFCIISVPISSSVSDSVNKVITLVILLFEFMAVYHYASRKGEFTYALSVIAICTSLMALYTIILGVSTLQTALRVGRITGDSNQVSAYLVYGIMILTYILFERKSYNWIHMIGIFASILAIILQGSRTGIVVSGVGLILLTTLLMKYNRTSFGKKLWITSILIVIIVGLYIQIMDNPILYRTLGRRLMSFYEIQVTGHSSINELSTYNRIQKYKLALNRFISSPLFGNGIASFSSYADKTIGYDGFCPNNYLELLQGIGIIGTLFYYWPYFYALKIAIVAFKRRKNSLSVLVVSVIITMLLEHITVVFYYHKLEYIFLGVILAICADINKDLIFEPEDDYEFYRLKSDKMRKQERYNSHDAVKFESQTEFPKETETERKPKHMQTKL